MATVLVMCDGSVTGLLAAAAAGLRAATGPRGVEPKAFICGPSEHHRKAATVQAAEFGLGRDTDQMPIDASPDGWVRELMEAALRVRRDGGGVLVWPVGPEGRDVDVAASARALTAAALVSQLISLTGLDSEPVEVQAPYADLSEDQVADLVLDMDLPIWTCWWMSAAELGEGDVKVRATQERERWRAALKRAGWAGSLEAKAAVHVKPAFPDPTQRSLGGKA
jgi:hypothetical protein